MNLMRLFPAYRVLENKLHDAVSSRIMAEDRQRDAQARLMAALEERDRIWDRLDKSLENERRLYQMRENIDMQQRYGGQAIPFPDAYHLPPARMKEEESGPVESIGWTGAQLVQRKMEEFRKKYPNVSVTTP